MDEKVYGGAVRITGEALMQLLNIKGALCHIQSDPLSHTFEFYFKGGVGEFPEIAEGNRTPQMKAEYTFQKTLTGGADLVRVDLVDIETQKSYNHYGGGQEDECKHCFSGTEMIDMHTAKWKDCFRSSKCKLLKAKEVTKCYRNSLPCTQLNKNCAECGAIHLGAQKAEEEKPREVLPCRYYPKSWSCSYPEEHCAECSMKKSADSSQCKLCYEGSLKCRSYGKADCKMAYLKHLDKGDESNEKANKKEEIREDRGEFPEAIPCPYNPICLCHIRPKEAGGLRCVSCGEREKYRGGSEYHTHNW